MGRDLSDIETYLHGIPIIFTVIFASAGIPLHLYNPIKNGIGCWVESYPLNCMKDDNVACIRGKYANTLTWFWGGGVILVSWVVVTVCMVQVWWRARSQLRQTMVGRRQTKEHQKGKDSHVEHLEEQALGTTAVVADEAALETMRKSVRFTSQQALFYASSFLLTYAPIFFIRSYERENSLSPDTLFVLTAVRQLLYPSQGLFICWIYFRPRVISVREANPDLAIFEIFYEAIFGKQ